MKASVLVKTVKTNLPFRVTCKNCRVIFCSVASRELVDYQSITIHLLLIHFYADPLPGAEKPSLDACSKLTVSNTIHNVTLRGGIKAGNFTDKGVVKNMEECSAFCCADEQCNVAFLIRDNCFLVACKDYDSCKMKPALSEYYRPRMAFVNWSPPDDEIPGTFFQGSVWPICTPKRHSFRCHKAYRGKTRTLCPLSHAICHLLTN